jgi:hypothetical protein
MVFNFYKYIYILLYIQEKKIKKSPKRSTLGLKIKNLYEQNSCKYTQLIQTQPPFLSSG